MVQFIACLGALLFERVARHIDAQRTVLLGLAAWTGTLYVDSIDWTVP